MKKYNMETKTALLLIDIQNDYFEGGSNPLEGSLEAGRKAQTILSHFRKHALPVIHIRHISDRPGSTFFLPDTEGANIHQSVAPIDGEEIVIKHCPNSFFQTDLLNLLKSKEITDLVVCGMMTHMCVDATVRAAKDLGYNSILIEDACATKDLKLKERTVKAVDVQTAFLSALTSFYSAVVLAEEYISADRKNSI